MKNEKGMVRVDTRLTMPINYVYLEAKVIFQAVGRHPLFYTNQSMVSSPVMTFQRSSSQALQEHINFL